MHLGTTMTKNSHSFTKLLSDLVHTMTYKINHNVARKQKTLF